MLWTTATTSCSCRKVSERGTPVDPVDVPVLPAALPIACRVAVGLPFRDPTYAFRGFDLDYVRGLGLKSGGFEISPELTLKTWIKGGRIHELAGRQGRRIAGESKFLFSEQAFGYARVLIEAFVQRRLGRVGRRRARSAAKTH